MWISLSALFLLASIPGTHPSDSNSQAEIGPEVTLAAPSRTLWLGRSSVLHFDFEGEADEDLELPVVLEPGGVVELRGPAVVLAGERTGSLRLRAAREGRTTLRIANAELELQVRPLEVEARLMRAEPEIVVPVEGAAVWDTFALACELTRDETRNRIELRLELPDGRLLEPMDAPRRMEGPTLRACFEVDARELQTGQQDLRVLALEDGVEIGSASRRLLVTRTASHLIQGECESALEQPRPESFGEAQPRLGGGAGASGDRYVIQATPYPQWVTAVTIPEAGRYQLMVTARGDFAGGAFPSLGSSLELPNPIRGATRVVHHDWHRLPVGPPLELETGTQVIGLRFINELNVGARSNRNLYLDSWELLHLETSDLGPVEASMMMASAAGNEYPSGPGFGLWVAFERPLDGLAVNGRLRVVGSSNWSGAVDSPAPRIDLLVDGSLHDSQQAARPVFLLDRAHLGAGEHELQLLASLPDGRQARTPVQRIHVPGPVAAVAPRERTRISVLDDRWGSSFDGALVQKGEEPRQRIASPEVKMEATLELPEHLTGTHRLILEARGPGGGGTAHVSVRLGDSDDTLELDVKNWWSERLMGELDLGHGSKTLHISLDPGSEDSFLRLRSLTFESTDRPQDRLPPTARILYPAAGHQAHGVDAVIVQAFDESAIQSADILIDGQLQGTYGYYARGAGPLVLPLLLRQIEPGEHTLAVRVSDASGNLGESESLRFTVSPAAPPEPGTYDRAIHLLERLAFGPDPLELAELLTQGEEAWLAAALNDHGEGSRVAIEWSRANLGDAIAYNAERLAVASAMRTDNPVRARFVLWTDNHFSTWAGKTGMPSEFGEHREYSLLGFAPFSELLLASATSPTMLRYLDQSESYAGRLNENYARELLELHTVGVDGGYSQEDVTHLAQLLCGITVSQEAPVDGSGAYLRLVLRSAPDLSDGQEQVLFGRRFEVGPPSRRFDRFMEVLELLASHPRTAKFVATKLAEHYVSSPPPPELVEHLSTVFLESGGDPGTMLTELVAHPSFWESARSPRLASPLHYGLRTARVLGYPQLDWGLCEFLRNSGMGMFDRATPDGYPDDDGAWADTNGLMQRWRWAQKVSWAVKALVPQRSRQYSGGDPLEWRQRVVDLAAVRLTGHVLGDESNSVALEYLKEDEGDLSKRVDRMTLLICRLPEANLK